MMIPTAERRVVIPENQIDYLIQYGSAWGCESLSEIVNRVIADHRIAGLQMIATNPSNGSSVAHSPIAQTTAMPAVKPTTSGNGVDADALANLLGD